jgi:flagellar motor switch protein FliM
MEAECNKVDFTESGKSQERATERISQAQEALARDLSINLSAFLRTTVTVKYTEGTEAFFGDALDGKRPCCVGLVLTRPDQRKLLLAVEYSILFPLIGISLGAKVGRFVSEERKPTDIELQVANLLLRIILGETYRAWAGLVKTPLETITLEIEQNPSRTFSPRDAVFVSRFELGAGENTGQLSLVAPAGLFASALAHSDSSDQPEAEENGSVDRVLDLLMPAKVSLDVWLDGSEMRLSDLLKLQEGQVIRLDHPVERRAACTLNGKSILMGQVVSTGTKRAFMLDDFSSEV